MSNSRILASCVLSLIIACALQTTSVHAQYEPPGNITVIVYRLNPSNGSIVVDPKTGEPIRCTKGARTYGCTADAEDPNHGYPFSSSTITIGIEGHKLNNVQQSYLHNVVPSEISIEGRHRLAIEAQAVAARSFAYFEIAHPTCSDGVAEINNSTADQICMPFMYATLSITDYRDIVDDAVAPRYYMSYFQSINACNATFTTEEPIFSEFSSDAYLATVDHPEQSKYPYMQGVPDPVSSHPEVIQIVQSQQPHQRGLSQNGASRWANGNLTSNPAGNKGVWSVRWTNSSQILTHYYTGVHMRDANNANAVVTPAYRWVPLRMEWLPGGDSPPSLCRNQPATVQVWVQNSGTTTWNLDATASDRVTLSYSAVENPGSPAAMAQVIGAQEDMLAPGQDALFAVQVGFAESGSYELRFDMYLGGQGFSTLEPARPWPVYDLLDITILPCVLDRFVYLPVIQEQAAANSAQ